MADLTRLEKAVLKWWRARRPIRWTKAQHISEPRINLQRLSEYPLADIAAEIAAKRRGVK